jgi:hypothetical protein
MRSAALVSRWIGSNAIARVQAVEHQLTEGAPVNPDAVLEKLEVGVGSDEGGSAMSEQELIRLRAWDDYQAAKKADAVFKAKLAGMARLMSRVAIRILAGGPIDAEDLAKWPSREELAAAMVDLKTELEFLSQCRASAESVGLPSLFEEVST